MAQEANESATPAHNTQTQAVRKIDYQRFYRRLQIYLFRPKALAYCG